MTGAAQGEFSAGTLPLARRLRPAHLRGLLTLALVSLGVLVGAFMAGVDGSRTRSELDAAWSENHALRERQAVLSGKLFELARRLAAPEGGRSAGPGANGGELPAARARETL